MRVDEEIEKILSELPAEVKEPVLKAFQLLMENVIMKIYEEVMNLRKDVEELKQIVKNLVEAQKRTEEKLNWLTEAQKKTEEKLNQLAEAQKKTEERLNQLAEAQKRTEERLNQLAEAQKKTEERLNQLTEAQKKTEERLNQLAEAQKRTEERLNQLAEAQKRTEERLNQLTEAQKRTENELEKIRVEHKKTRTQLGGLSDSFGYLLEDRAIKSLPKILKGMGIKVEGKLKRTYLQIGKEYIEVNIYGEAKKGKEKVIILGEAKSRATKKLIDELIKKSKKVGDREKRKVVKILVCYIFSPDIESYARQKDVLLVPSYELEL